MKGKCIIRYGTQLDTRFLTVNGVFEQLDGKRLGKNPLYDRPHERNWDRQVNIEGQPDRAGQRHVEEVSYATVKCFQKINL